jgi:hypothetical protein
MKRRSIEDFQRERAARAARTTPGDEERKARIKAHGLECLRRLHGDQTWEDWMGTGEAMMVITEEALAEVGATEWDPTNKRLVREFNERWDQYERGAGSNYKPLTKQERWALREVVTNPEIGAFRGLLDGPQKRRLNHPNAVINKWKASTRVKEPKERKPSDLLSPALAEKSKVIEQLEARNAELQEELETRETAPSLTPDQHVDALIAQLREGLTKELVASINRLTAVIREIQRGQKPAKPRKRGALKQVQDDINAALRGLMK